MRVRKIYYGEGEVGEVIEEELGRGAYREMEGRLELYVAGGRRSFVRLLCNNNNNNIFRKSQICGLIHRTLSLSRLELLKFWSQTSEHFAVV